jgi:hypothetical protein
MPRKKLSATSHLKQANRERLEATGWKVGSAKDFLDLTPEEAAFVELKLTLSASLKERRRPRERKRPCENSTCDVVKHEL